MNENPACPPILFPTHFQFIQKSPTLSPKEKHFKLRIYTINWVFFEFFGHKLREFESVDGSYGSGVRMYGPASGDAGQQSNIGSSVWRRRTTVRGDSAIRDLQSRIQYRRIFNPPFSLW